MSSISYIILAYVQIVVKLIRYALRGLCSVVFSGFFFFSFGLLFADVVDNSI